MASKPVAACGSGDGRGAAPRPFAVLVAFAFSVASLATVPGPATAQVSDLVTRTSLRVCADPADLPMSNRDGEGYENKVAEFLAEKLELPLEYYWFPQVTGWYRNTLGARVCDVTLNVVSGGDPIQNTNHYYASAWVLVVRQDDQELAGVQSLSDEALRDKRIGVIAGTPPATHLQRNGLMARAKPYALMVDRRYDSPSEDVLRDIADGTVDAGVVWGPVAGYFIQKSELPLDMILLINERRPALTHRMTFGIRPGELNWRRQLNAFILDHREELTAIMREYNVPLLDDHNRPLPQ